MPILSDQSTAQRRGFDHGATEQRFGGIRAKLAVQWLHAASMFGSTVVLRSGERNISTANRFGAPTTINHFI